MSDDLLVTAFATLDSPVEPRPEFSVQLLDRLLTQVETADRATDPQQSQRPRRTWWRPGRRWSFSVAMAAGVAASVAALLVVVGGEPPRANALAIVTAARARFATLPPLHVVYTAHREMDHPDVKSITTYDVWYADATHWRSSVIAATGRWARVGDFRVADGTVEAEYATRTGVLDVRRVADVGGPVVIADLSPQTMWEQAGSHGQSPQAWFGPHCTATPQMFLKREATRLSCDRSRVTAWIDRETGLLLKTVERPTIREVRSLVLQPPMPDHLFTVTKPTGAIVKWSGSGSARSAYVTKPGPAVRQTVHLRGLYAPAMTATDDAIWVAAPANDREGAPTWLQRVDAATGAVTTTVRGPPGAWALAFGGGTLWVGVPRGGHPGPSYLLPLDPLTGRTIGPRLLVARSGGDGTAGLAATADALWFATGLVQVPLPDGGTWPRQRLARISLPDHRITMLELRGSVSTLATGFGSLWAAEETPRWHTSNIEAVSRIDPTSGRVQARFVLPAVGGLTAIAVGDRYVYTSALTSTSDEYRCVLVAIDPVTNRVVTSRAAYGRPVWADGALLLVDSLHGVVQRLDPMTLRPVGSVRVGGTPTLAAAAGSSVWVVDSGSVVASRIDVAAMR